MRKIEKTYTAGDFQFVFKKLPLVTKLGSKSNTTACSVYNFRKKQYVACISVKKHYKDKDNTLLAFKILAGKTCKWLNNKGLCSYPNNLHHIIYNSIIKQIEADESLKPDIIIFDEAKKYTLVTQVKIENTDFYMTKKEIKKLRKQLKKLI